MVSVKKTVIVSTYLFCVYLVSCCGIAFAETNDYILKKTRAVFRNIGIRH